MTMIKIAYKESATGYRIIPGQTEIHQADAYLLITQVWTRAYSCKDTEGFLEGEDGDIYTVEADGDTWRAALDKYSDLSGSDFIHGYLKKNLGFALPVTSH